jgi:hypothetical protein
MGKFWFWFIIGFALCAPVPVPRASRFPLPESNGSMWLATGSELSSYYKRDLELVE